MYVVAVEFVIHPQHVESFRTIVLKQAENSLKREPDCHQFDVAQDCTNEQRFFLYEVYENAEAFDVHRKTAHFAQFTTDVTELVADKKIQNWNLLSGLVKLNESQ